MSKKILILIESINLNDSSGIKGRLSLIKNLAQLGHNLKVYHLDTSNPIIDGVETLALSRNKTSAFYWLARLKTLFSKGGLNFNRYVEERYGFSFSHYEDVGRFKKALSQENQDHYDIVFTLSKASSFRPHKAVLESPKWHSKWYAYIHDPYPMYAYPRPYDWAEPGSLKKRAFFLELYKKSKKVVYPSLLLAEWMESYYDGSTKRLIIPHQIDQELAIASQTRVLPDFFDPDNFNILHAGSLMKQRPPFILIKAFQDFLKKRPEAKIEARLIFIGNVFDGHKKELNSYASSNVIVHNQYMDFNVVFELQQQASMNVVIEANTPYSPFLPGKMPHLVIADKPILHVGPAYSETMRLLGEEYPWHVSNHESHVTKLSEKLVLAYKEWSTKKSFSLQRADLKEYLSKINLE